VAHPQVAAAVEEVDAVLPTVANVVEEAAEIGAAAMLLPREIVHNPIRVVANNGVEDKPHRSPNLTRVAIEAAKEDEEVRIRHRFTMVPWHLL